MSGASFLPLWKNSAKKRVKENPIKIHLCLQHGKNVDTIWQPNNSLDNFRFSENDFGINMIIYDK